VVVNEDMEPSDRPWVVRHAPKGILQNGVSPRGICGTTPERITEAIEHLETIYVDPDRREEDETGEADGDGEEAMSSVGNDRLRPRLPETSLPGRSKAPGLKGRNKDQKMTQPRRRPLQELDVESLLDPRFAAADANQDNIDNNTAARSLSSPITDGDQGLSTGTPNKENVKPSTTAMATAASAPANSTQRRNRVSGWLSRRIAAVHSDVRPPGMSQLVWVRRRWS